MFAIQLEAKSIAACDRLPIDLKFMQQALQHQVDLCELGRDRDLILDLAPTGTGKTQAGLSILLHNKDKSAIYIAPTNALVTQQREAAQKFITNSNLSHVFKSATAKEIRSWSNRLVGKRSGEKVYNLLRNPATIFPEVGANRPLLLVTNPDIFYYAIFFSYNRLDRSNIASEFYSKFSTIIFDEFHLYNAKQLVSLLFYLAASKELGYFASGRKIVLLTATPEPACEVALDSLKQQGVKIGRVDGEESNNNLLPSQTPINLLVKSQLERDDWLEEMADEIERRLKIYPDKNGAVILDSKDLINRLADLLKSRKLEKYFGRITGSTPPKDRFLAAQKQVILATSTVDVGFNFERERETNRQNLDWLIFSARDRFSFWQRLGRVGRVLGKTETNNLSDAIAYLHPTAWEDFQKVSEQEKIGDRQQLKKVLENISSLNRPFLKIYWRSEAFLEIARPLLELEEGLTNLPEFNLINNLYTTLQIIFGGKKDWNYYRYRMKILKGAENIADLSIDKIQKQWQYIKYGQIFVRKFL
jgi:CRISPR-associated endonuclease/helicase Cas3